MNITDWNCKEPAFNQPYGIIKDHFDWIGSILTGSFEDHGRLKQFIKAAS
jgi:hypothetical protein